MLKFLSTYYLDHIEQRRYLGICLKYMMEPFIKIDNGF